MALFALNPHLLPWVALLAVAFLLRKPIHVIWSAWKSPLRDLPGPKPSNWLFGHLREVLNADGAALQEQWVTQYGPTLRYSGFFGVSRLFTLDPRAITHILSNTEIYQKPETVRFNISRILGDGLLITEGIKHKQQRRVMNPAFGPAQIRALMDIFYAKSIQLKDIWSSEIEKAHDQQHRTDVLSWLTRATLDIIGLAGFDYQFDNLNTEGRTNELATAFEVMFKATQNFSVFPLLQAFVPPLRLIPTNRARRIDEAQGTMRRIGQHLLREKREAILKEARLEKGGIVDKSQLAGRDLLSVLMKANMAEDVDESQRMSDEDVLAQVPTFLVAGHETTSSTTTWCLYSLCLHKDMQEKLREELLSIPDDMPSMDMLHALPYLDAVVRETMRYHSVVPAAIRCATKDDVIPLLKSIVDRHGKTIHGIRISKGDPIFVPILPLNRTETIWGADAHEFKPDRWFSVPSEANALPSVWGKSMSFLGGPRACIGWRFAILEMKALLFTLIRAFEFELAVPAEDIIRKATIVQRPMVRTEPEKGNQLPLIIRPYRL